MVCPFLEYRPLDAAGSGEAGEVATGASGEPRAYCTAADRFVQPLRADICNDRYELAHDRDCEIYREHADGPSDAHRPSEDDSP